MVNTLSYDANGAITHYDIAGTGNVKCIAYNAGSPIGLAGGNGPSQSTVLPSQRLGGPTPF